MAKVFTIGYLLRHFRESRPSMTESQLRYAIESYRIEPQGRVGIVRVWAEDSLPLIASALQRISRRGERL